MERETKMTRLNEIEERLKVTDIEAQALKEIREEKFRQEVERRKAWLRRPLLKRIFPYAIKITIKRR